MFTPFAFYGKAEEGYPWVTTDLRFKVDANYYGGSGDWLDIGDAGLGNDLTLSTPYNWTNTAVDGSTGYYFDFDNTGFGYANNNTQILSSYSNITNTVEVVVNSDQNRSPQGNQIYVSQRTSGNTRWFESGQKVQSYPDMAWSDGTTNDLFLRSTTSLVQNDWYMLTFIMLDGDQRIYRNNSLDTSGTYSFSTGLGNGNPSSSDWLFIGCRGAGNSPASAQFGGKIAAVAIYERELTASERLQNYQHYQTLYPI